MRLCRVRVLAQTVLRPQRPSVLPGWRIAPYSDHAGRRPGEPNILHVLDMPFEIRDRIRHREESGDEPRTFCVGLYAGSSASDVYKAAMALHDTSKIASRHEEYYMHGRAAPLMWRLSEDFRPVFENMITRLAATQEPLHAELQAQTYYNWTKRGPYLADDLRRGIRLTWSSEAVRALLNRFSDTFSKVLIPLMKLNGPTPEWTAKLGQQWTIGPEVYSGLYLAKHALETEPLLESIKSHVSLEAKPIKILGFYLLPHTIARQETRRARNYASHYDVDPDPDPFHKVKFIPFQSSTEPLEDPPGLEV